jgi:hypothetical protein
MTTSKALYTSVILTISNAEQKELRKFAVPTPRMTNQFAVSQAEYDELRKFSNETNLSYHENYIYPADADQRAPVPVFVDIAKIVKKGDLSILPVTGKYLEEIAGFEKAEASIELQGLNPDFSEYLIEVSIKHGEPNPEIVDMVRALEEGDRNNLLTSGTVLNMFFGYAKLFYPAATDDFQTEVTLLGSDTDPAISIVINHMGVKSDV